MRVRAFTYLRACRIRILVEKKEARLNKKQLHTWCNTISRFLLWIDLFIRDLCTFFVNFLILISFMTNSILMNV